jgi:hypothetical protein
MELIDLIAFRAPERPDLCIEYLREHRKVLADFGITGVSSNSTDWLNDRECIVIVALHERLGMVGGIRLQRSHEGDPLPIEHSLRKLAPSIADEIAALRPHGVGEVCGLWNANRYAGHGVPVLLSHAITAVSLPSGMKRMVCLVAHYTERHPRTNGFVRMEGLGEKGTFPKYPIPSHTAVAMVNPDTTLLPHATEAQRHLLFSLRLRPDQVAAQAPAGKLLEVHYHLRLSASHVGLTEYNAVQIHRMRHSA